MRKQDFEKLQELEGKATEKLIQYINKQGNISYIYDRMLGKYPFLQEESAKLPFNIWLCCDYRDKEGLSFADHIVHDNPLISDEIAQILKEKTTSYVSLFQIDDFNEPYVDVEDIFTGEKHTLLEPQVSYVLKEGDYLLSRLGTVLGHKRMIGEVSYVPKSVVHSFIRIVIKNFNRLDPEIREQGILSYLKRDALVIYDMFYQSAYRYFDPDSEDIIPIYQELDEFEEYLTGKSNPQEIEKHLSNMIEIYEYYLSEEGYSLKDLDKISIEEVLMDAIYEKFVTSGLAFNSYLNTLKTYLGYRSKISKAYSQAFDEINDISKNRFLYIKEILSRNSLAQGDPLLSLKLRDYDSPEMTAYINDFDRFLLYVLDYPLELTEKKKFIKKTDQENINDLFEKDYYLFFSRAHQMKSPAIQFFFDMALKLKLLKIRKNSLSATANATEYMSMSREDKFTLHLRGLWSTETLKSLLAMGLREGREARKTMAKILERLEMGPIHRSDLPKSDLLAEDDVYLLVRYMTFMGILSNGGYDSLVSINSEGRLVASHLKEWDSPRKNNVINLGQYLNGHKGDDKYGESKTGGFDEL